MQLLPPNASALELALTSLTNCIEKIPVPIGSLYAPSRCPAPLLPWLAWAFSVDVWSDAWDETTQRHIIAHSLLLHQKKGTRAAVRTALELLKITTTLVEWWQTTPNLPPHTFKVVLESNTTRVQRIIDRTLYQQIAMSVHHSKPVRSHFELQVQTQFKASMGLGLKLRAKAYIEIQATFKRQISPLYSKLGVSIQMNTFARFR